MLSGWGDSNSRPLRPERSALTGLRYTPYMNLTIYENFTGKIDTFISENQIYIILSGIILVYNINTIKNLTFIILFDFVVFI